ncbi:beta-ketoacyl synthase [Gramella sp. GC03-9]|uniref:Beta-ketoacyl synthase n=1 Tax=Christiangramia oceanisediminis TaxID=2920386 RepID=A0A9X2RD06_9FLAO|nr:beta-ketoacyl synthase N-terminal-like domain-containing protein [Gramella oceanisediminis]MCP9200471.1 beta-ketoacyl synthase [Gramella oceanisediminis]
MNLNFLLGDSIISPLGFGTQLNLEAIRQGETALQSHTNLSYQKDSFYAGIIDNDLLDEAFSRIGNLRAYTKLEKMMLLSIHQVLEDFPYLDLERTGLVIATTKANIDELGKGRFSEDRLMLWKLGEVVAKFFGFQDKPMIVSNACVSGALALKLGNDLIQSGRFDHVMVAGGDLVSEFVLSGFNSFQAISPEPCRPFSNDRQGISLGEAAAAMLIGPKTGKGETRIGYIDAVTANDANHISGPSRTGEGLYSSISRLLKANKVKPSEIDFLSAHGTATAYNDEMESIAFNRAGLQDIPVNSLKGYYGHSLGASALIESIITRHNMLNNELFASRNFTDLGVSRPLNIIQQHRSSELNLALKTASGFGGCNLAMFLKKVQDE